MQGTAGPGYDGNQGLIDCLYCDHNWNDTREVCSNWAIYYFLWFLFMMWSISHPMWYDRGFTWICPFYSSKRHHHTQMKYSVKYSAIYIDPCIRSNILSNVFTVERETVAYFFPFPHCKFMYENAFRNPTECLICELHCDLDLMQKLFLITFWHHSYKSGTTGYLSRQFSLQFQTITYHKVAANIIWCSLFVFKTYILINIFLFRFTERS